MNIYRIVYEGSDVWVPGEKDVISPKVEIELNTAGRLTFILTTGHPNFHTIQPLIGTIEVYENSDLIWFGRAISVERNIKNQKPVYCEGALAYFNDSAQEPREIASTDVQTLLESIVDAHNAQVPNNRQFTLGTVESVEENISWENGYTSTLNALTNLLGRVGGYFIPRRANGTNTLDFIKVLPLDYYQAIEYGVNMTAFKREYTFAERVTAVLPLGGTAEGQSGPTTIASVNDGEIILDGGEVNRFGRIVRVINFPEVNIPSALKKAAEIYLENAAYNPINISAKAVDLSFIDAQYHPFRVGNQYCVYSEPHEVQEYLPLVKLGISMDTAVREVELSSEQDLVNVDIQKFTLISMCGDFELKRRVYHFPVGYEYSIELQNITVYSVEGEIVYTPIEPIVSGTMSSTDETYNAYYLGKYFLTIIAQCDGIELNRYTYQYFAGETYDITLQPVTIVDEGEEMVYRPIQSSFSGTMPNSNYTITASYKLFNDNTVLIRGGSWFGSDVNRKNITQLEFSSQIVWNNRRIDTQETNNAVYSWVDNNVAYYGYDYDGGYPKMNANCADMFYSWNSLLSVNFDGVNLDTIAHCDNMFRYCKNFNSPVTLGKNVVTATNMFYNCFNFNQPITMNNNVTNCGLMFCYCINLNSPVIISESAYNCAEMFRLCYRFNQPVVIPDSVHSVYGMFNNCSNLNQKVTIGNGVTRTTGMFANCRNFNQPVVVPGSAVSTINMFFNCVNLNQPVTISEGVVDVTNMFQNCFNFNAPVTTASTITNYAEMFRYCYNFNQAVEIHNGAVNTDSMFLYCHNFNQPVNIPEGVVSSYAAFSGCSVLNSPITFPSTLDGRMQHMFYGCYNFNQPVVMPESTTNCLSTFAQCYDFNQPIVIPGNVTDCSSMFIDCHSFDQPINIPENVTNCAGMFVNCYNFNQPITIPETAPDCQIFLNGCHSFNQPFVIPTNATSCYGLFQNCWEFNQSVTIPENVTSCENMFFCCNNFNQPVVIPEGVINCMNMFRECNNFNQPINIPASVKNCLDMFMYCNNFNSPVTIPEGVTNSQFMFYGCYNFNQPVTIPVSVTNCRYMFTNCNNYRATVSVPTLKSSTFTYSYLGLNSRNATIVYY